MNDTKQTLEALLDNSQPDKLTSGLQDQLQLFFAISVAISLIFIVLLIVNLIYKWRVQAAILRIDKNVQKLVDGQKAPPTSQNDE